MATTWYDSLTSLQTFLYNSHASFVCETFNPLPQDAHSPSGVSSLPRFLFAVKYCHSAIFWHDRRPSTVTFFVFMFYEFLKSLNSSSQHISLLKTKNMTNCYPFSVKKLKFLIFLGKIGGPGKKRGGVY